MFCYSLCCYGLRAGSSARADIRAGCQLLASPLPVVSAAGVEVTGRASTRPALGAALLVSSFLSSVSLVAAKAHCRGHVFGQAPCGHPSFSCTADPASRPDAGPSAVPMSRPTSLSSLARGVGVGLPVCCSLFFSPRSFCGFRAGF